jgi:uncharacterized protein involved in exopolysaccharide biosynthesis
MTDAHVSLRQQIEAVEIAINILNGASKPRLPELIVLRNRLRAAAETLRKEASKTGERA